MCCCSGNESSVASRRPAVQVRSRPIVVHGANVGAFRVAEVARKSLSDRTSPLTGESAANLDDSHRIPDGGVNQVAAPPIAQPPAIVGRPHVVEIDDSSRKMRERKAMQNRISSQPHLLLIDRNVRYCNKKFEVTLGARSETYYALESDSRIQRPTTISSIDCPHEEFHHDQVKTTEFYLSDHDEKYKRPSPPDSVT